MRRRRSRSSDAIQRLNRELNLSEEILSEELDGATERTVDKAWRCIERHVSLVEIFKTASCKHINATSNNQTDSSSFAKTRRVSTSRIPARTRLSLTASTQFPVEAFTADNFNELCNPDLFSEVYPMAYTSAAIFALAGVRQAARKGKIDTMGLDIVSTPVATGSILKVFEENQSYFEKKLKVADYDFLKSVSINTQFNADMDSSVNEISKTASADKDRKRKTFALINAISIEYFGDENAELECMYMITRNPMNKRIALIFRGSITVQDWIKDSKLVVSDIENPVSDRPNQLPMIGVHKGFREYLYDETRTNSPPDNVNETTDTQTIRQSSTAIETSEDDKIEIVMEPDCHDNVSEDPNDTKQIDKVQGEKNALSIQDEPSEIATTKQKEQRSTNDLLTYLGLDLSTIKEKQKSLWSSMKWNGNLDPTNENQEVIMTDFLSIFTTSKRRASKKSRLAKILDEITNLQRQHDDYRIYITGHSLGGALGLLAALEIAARFGKKEQPVTFIGVANPRAGTEGFRDAVEVLEREGKMRCLSIHGRFDAITMLPNSTFFNRGTKRRFCQSGFELLVNSEASKLYMRRSERNDEKYIQRLGLALFRADKVAERHHFATYLRDLEALERPLHKLYLNDFYNKFVEQSLFPCSEKKMTPMKVRAGRGRQSVAVVRPPSKRELKKILSAGDLFARVQREELLEHYDE